MTELSARDLSCSDQLKPCWSAREGTLSEGALGCLVWLALGSNWGCGMAGESGMAALARRPAAERAAATAEPCACDGLRPALGERPSEGGGEVGLLLPLPGLPPGRYPLMDWPKLMRRTKGVPGAVLALPAGVASSSSMALSSIESEFVDMLPRRMAKGVVLVGEVPERPIVVTERRRRWGSLKEPLAAYDAALEPADGPRWKRLERAAWVMELRRWAGGTAALPPRPLGELSEDIVDWAFGGCSGQAGNG